MGYRSNIYVMAGEEVYKQLYAVMQKHNWNPDNLYKVKDNNLFIFHLIDYKWYDSYDDVQEFESVLDNADEEENESYAYKLIRVGEELTDVEVRQNDCTYNISEFDYFGPFIQIEEPDTETIDELV